ncbi:MAG: hypothetical protein AAF211_21255, partial [Myxococcota bacterium]
MTEALDGEVEHLELSGPEQGVYTLTGRIRADVDDPTEAVLFIEELAAETLEAPVFVVAPVVDRDLPGRDVYTILDTPDRQTD